VSIWITEIDTTNGSHQATDIHQSILIVPGEAKFDKGEQVFYLYLEWTDDETIGI
jgi:hypothetical protein